MALVDPQARPRRIARELAGALAKSRPRELARWGARGARRFGAGAVDRVKKIGKLLAGLAGGAVAEAVDAVANRRRLRQHLAERSGEAFGATVETGTKMTRAGRGYASIVRKLRTRPKEAAPVLFGSVVGLVLGSRAEAAGNEKAGLPDLDVLWGIGSRSLLLQTVLGGALAEAVILSALDLALVVQERLPEDRDPLWDELLEVATAFAFSMRGTAAELPGELSSEKEREAALGKLEKRNAAAKALGALLRGS